VYSVRVQKRNGRYYCYITFEEEVIGIDINAYPSHIAWAEVGKYGNLKGYLQIFKSGFLPHLTEGVVFSVNY